MKAFTDLGLAHVEYASVSVMESCFPDHVPHLRVIGVTCRGLVYGREQPSRQCPIGLAQVAAFEGRTERVSSYQKTVAGRQVPVSGAGPKANARVTESPSLVRHAVT